MDKRRTYVIGIDEAGRGPLAGPVAVGGAIIEKRMLSRMKQSDLLGIRDSKKLTPAAREEWYARMCAWQKEGKIHFAVSFVSAESIDKHGIVPAIDRGIRSVLRRLGADPACTRVLLDGGIYAPEQFTDQKTIIRGDDSEACISLAAIAAKVLRDRKMARYALQFKGYGFEVHKGYGTKAHRSQIKRKGITPIHRKTFIKKIMKKTL